MEDVIPQEKGKGGQDPMLPVPASPVASITETGSMLEQAEKIALRIEAASKRAEDAAARQEAIAARIMLSGRADAGSKSKTQEQTDEEKVNADVEAALKRYT